MTRLLSDPDGRGGQPQPFIETYPHRLIIFPSYPYFDDELTIASYELGGDIVGHVQQYADSCIAVIPSLNGCHFIFGSASIAPPSATRSPSLRQTLVGHVQQITLCLFGPDHISELAALPS